MRHPLAALWILCLAVGIVPPLAMALSPVPPVVVFCAPGSSVIAPTKDIVLQSAAENYWRRITPGRVGVWAYTNLPEASEASLALSTGCAYAVKRRLVALGVPSDQIDIGGVHVSPLNALGAPGYTVVEIK
jgi:hypothetical protein